MSWRDMIGRGERRASFLIDAASWLVPRRARAEWRREWSAELHFALREMRDRGDDAGAKAVAFARGAFHDALWHRLSEWNCERRKQAFSRVRQSAGFSLAALALVISLVAIVSGFLPETRAVLLPLPYADAGRIATVTQGGAEIAMRSGVHRQWVEWWREDSRLIDGAATYSWSEKQVAGVKTLEAKVSAEFFAVLGLGDPFRGCPACALLSYDFVRREYGGKTPASIAIGGKQFGVAAVLDRRFWFLTRRIGVWTMETGGGNQKAGVVLRLKPDVSPAQAEAELERIVQKRGVNPWSALIDISPLAARVRSVFGSFALALVLGVGTILPALRTNWSAVSRRAAFFCAKTALLLVVVLLAGIEFTRAASITMLGGTDLATEPVSTWLFLLGSMGALSWSIHDQRRRCRVCLRRYGLAAQIGCPGCILLSWSGTELVCLEGHGTLQVAERVTSWQDPERWTSLDDSVLELFASE